MTEEELNFEKEKEIAILELQSQQKDNKNNRLLDRDFARSAVGQGLFFGYGDEIEAKIRSLVGKKTYE